MAKKCKLIHINDGSATTVENGNFHFVEEFDWTAKYLERYLNEGYEVKHMVPEVSPAIQGDGSYCFYKSGFTFYLECEESDSIHSGDEVEGEDLNDIFAGIDDDITDEMLADIFSSDEDDIDGELLTAPSRISDEASSD